MDRAHWKWLHEQWPILFTMGVAMWFVLTGLGVGDHLPNFSGSSDDDIRAAATASTETTETTVTNSGAFAIKVISFRLQTDKKSPGTLDANVTLEARNTTKADAQFKPAQLQLRRVGGDSKVPEDFNTPVKVSPRSPVIVPATFPVPAEPGGNYEMTYGDRVVFAGKPI